MRSRTFDRRKSLQGLLLIILACLVFFSNSLTPSATIPISHAQTLNPSCVSHDSSTQTVSLRCGDATLADLERVLDDGNLLTEESDRVWLLSTDLVVENGASLYVTGSEVSWLKIETPHGLVGYGNIVIDSVKVTSWDSTIQNYAQTNGQQPRSYIAVLEGSNGQMNITNSEIAYLGYSFVRKQGLAYYSGDGSVVRNNTIHHMWYGFYSHQVGFMKIENNHSHDNENYGFDPHTGTHDMVIRNNVVHDIANGIGIICSFDCYNILMENNIVYDVSVVGLMLSRNTTGSTVRHNSVYNSGTDGAGISIDDSRGNEVYNNTLSVGRYGIKVTRDSNYNRIYDNTISNYKGYGICMIEGSSHNVIYDNTVSNLDEYGICALSGGSGNEIFSNEVIAAGYYGIYVRDANAMDNVFKSNSIFDSGQNGVRVFNNTGTTFIDNSVTRSTKTDYSAAAADLILYNTTFSSTYLDGIEAQVKIMNSDNRIIMGDQKLNNMVENGRVSVNFELTNGDRAVLTTIPFLVTPRGSPLDVVVLDARIDTNSARITWIENSSTRTGATAVHHRLEGLNPGLSIEVMAGNNTTTLVDGLVDPDRAIEFSTEQIAGETIYSLTSGSGDSAGTPELTDLFDSPNGNSDFKTYGCEIYGTTVRCDLLLSDFPTHSVEGRFKLLHPLATTAAFAEGKYGDSIKLSAKYRESVEIMNTPSINSEQFSISFWVRNSEEAEPYGHIISHVNFRGTAGWLVDMTSTTDSQPFAQRLQFAVTNTQKQFFAPADVEIPQDRFVHLAGVFDGSFVRIYVDGKLAGEVPFRGEHNPDPGTPLKIGSASYSTSTHRWSGFIDDLKLFNRALSADEIAAISKEALAGEISQNNNPDSNGLAAHWTFESNVNDVTGQGNDGALTTLLASMAFSPDGRMFFSEKNTGNIRIMKDDVILEEPFAYLSDVYVSWEQGILGLTIDPRFEDNHYVYQYYTYMDASAGEVFNRVVRFTDVNSKGIDMKILLDRIPAVRGYHSGGALAFGDDDRLYITVGDATEHPFAQDPNALIGKVLRIDRDGGIPSDNPNPDSPVYTKGHRNAYGIAFDGRGTGIITENGEAAYDEINLIIKDGNYGFPTLQPANVAPELADPSKSILPAKSYYETIAPTQAIYYTSDKIPELKDRFLFGTFTGDIYALEIDPDSKKVTAEERIDLYPVLFTPVIGIAQAPNGDLYYGSYGIFKLESLDLGSRIVSSYPIRVASSEGVAINNLVFDQDRKRTTLDVSLGSPSPTSETLSDHASESFRSVSVKIPKTLMDEITTVLVEGDERALEFMVTSGGGASSEGGYNTITIALDSIEKDSRVSVISARVIPEFPLSQLWLMLSILGFMIAAIILSTKPRLTYGWKI